MPVQRSNRLNQTFPRRQRPLKRKATLSTSNAGTSGEQWAVNKAVHYNAWANFGKKDFEPVVAAFKQLLACFTCEKCNSWLTTTRIWADFDAFRRADAEVHSTHAQK